jgi:hypothetical protein
VDSPLWEEFSRAARRRRRNPSHLLMEYMRECLEVWEDQKLDQEISGDVQAFAQREGLTEADAVDIVRKYRREKQAMPRRERNAPT